MRSRAAGLSRSKVPSYDFAAPDGTTFTVYLDLKQPAIAYREQVIHGQVCKRIYEVPQMAVNTAAGTGRDDFRRKTEGKNLKLGEMADISKEMSHTRAEREGRDPVREQHYQTYEKQMGSKHQDVVKRTKEEAREGRLAKAKRNLTKFGVKVSLD